MPRDISGRMEAQRERQRRYRRRLRSTGTPEASAVDVAVSATVSALAETLRRSEEQAREALQARREALRADMASGVLSDEEADDALAGLMLPSPVPEAHPLRASAYVQRVLQGAVALLVDRGSDPAAARRMVIWRLGRGGSLAELDDLIMRSGVTLGRRRSGEASRGHAT